MHTRTVAPLRGHDIIFSIVVRVVLQLEDTLIAIPIREDGFISIQNGLTSTGELAEIIFIQTYVGQTIGRFLVESRTISLVVLLCLSGQSFHGFIRVIDAGFVVLARGVHNVVAVSCRHISDIYGIWIIQVTTTSMVKRGSPKVHVTQ